MLKCYSASSQTILHCGNENDPANFSLQGGGFNHCDDNPNPRIDLGNFMYIPNGNDPIHTIRINLHVMQFSNANPNNFENIPAHINHLNALINSAEGQVFNNSNDLEECNGGNTTAPPTPDTRIRLQLDNIFFHVDPIGHTNNDLLNGALTN